MYRRGGGSGAAGEASRRERGSAVDCVHRELGQVGEGVARVRTVAGVEHVPNLGHSGSIYHINIVLVN